MLCKCIVVYISSNLNMTNQFFVHRRRNADIYFNLGVLYAEKEKWDRAKARHCLCAES